MTAKLPHRCVATFAFMAVLAILAAPMIGCSGPTTAETPPTTPEEAQTSPEQPAASAEPAIPDTGDTTEADIDIVPQPVAPVVSVAAPTEPTPSLIPSPSLTETHGIEPGSPPRLVDVEPPALIADTYPSAGSPARIEPTITSPTITEPTITEPTITEPTITEPSTSIPPAVTPPLATPTDPPSVDDPLSNNPLRPQDPLSGLFGPNPYAAPETPVAGSLTPGLPGMGSSAPEASDPNAFAPDLPGTGPIVPEFPGVDPVTPDLSGPEFIAPGIPVPPTPPVTEPIVPGVPGVEPITPGLPGMDPTAGLPGTGFPSPALLPDTNPLMPGPITPSDPAVEPITPTPSGGSPPATDPSIDIRATDPLRFMEPTSGDTADNPSSHTPAATDDNANPLGGLFADEPADSTAADSHGGKSGESTFDPIKENGPIFVGWPKPTLAIVISGRQKGYIEPCGCAGLDRMKGGMNRRHTLFKTLEKWGWPTVGIDVGGIARGFGKQAEMKFHTMVNGMLAMDYEAIALGKTDLGLPASELVAVTADPSPFVSANVGLLGMFDPSLLANMKIIEANGKRLAITSVLGDKYAKELHNSQIQTVPAAAAIGQILPKMKAAKPDLMILLAHATMEETKSLATQFPDFNIIVTAGGMPQPPALPTILPGTKTMLVDVGEKGMDAVVLGVYNNPHQMLRYQRVPLDSRFAQSPEMTALMTGYQDEVRRAGLAGLGLLRTVPHPQADKNGEFIGSSKCQNCHEGSYATWKKSGHAHAFATLQNLTPPREHDPECISCHVVGWHPTSYFPYTGGYQSLEKTPHLIDVGCESCHGPGSLHAKAEKDATDEAMMERYRTAVRITLEESKERQCLTCHDGDNSPSFDFDTYWPKIEHHDDE